MNLLWKIFVLIFPLLVYGLLFFLYRFLALARYTRVRIMDLMIPFLLIGLYAFLENATTLSVLPYYVFLVAGIGLIFLLLDLFYFQKFSFSIFFKRFWRATFFATAAMYFSLIIASLFF